MVRYAEPMMQPVSAWRVEHDDACVTFGDRYVLAGVVHGWPTADAIDDDA